MKIDHSDDLDGDPGIVLEYHDAPGDIIDHADAIHALGKLTEQIASILAGAGKHPNIVEMAEYQIRQIWVYAMRTTHESS